MWTVFSLRRIGLSLISVCGYVFAEAMVKRIKCSSLYARQLIVGICLVSKLQGNSLHGGLINPSRKCARLAVCLATRVGLARLLNISPWCNGVSDHVHTRVGGGDDRYTQMGAPGR